MLHIHLAHDSLLFVSNRCEIKRENPRVKRHARHSAGVNPINELIINGCFMIDSILLIIAKTSRQFPLKKEGQCFFPYVLDRDNTRRSQRRNLMIHKRPMIQVSRNAYSTSAIARFSGKNSWSRIPQDSLC